MKLLSESVAFSVSSKKNTPKRVTASFGILREGCTPYLCYVSFIKFILIFISIYKFYSYET
jgi:hypothetical protein